MAKEKKPLECLGELVCDCGRKAYVEQTTRPGNFVQLKCGHCGTDQRRGAHLQKLWRESCVPKGTLINGVDCLDFGETDPDVIAAFQDARGTTSASRSDTKNDTKEANQPEESPAGSPPEKPPESPAELSAEPDPKKRPAKKKKRGGSIYGWVAGGVLVVTVAAGVLGSMVGSAAR